MSIAVSCVPTYPYGTVGLIIPRYTDLCQQSLHDRPRDPRANFIRETYGTVEVLLHRPLASCDGPYRETWNMMLVADQNANMSRWIMCLSGSYRAIPIASHRCMMKIARITGNDTVTARIDARRRLVSTNRFSAKNILFPSSCSALILGPNEDQRIMTGR